MITSLAYMEFVPCISNDAEPFWASYDTLLVAYSSNVMTHDFLVLMECQVAFGLMWSFCFWNLGNSYFAAAKFSFPNGKAISGWKCGPVV